MKDKHKRKIAIETRFLNYGCCRAEAYVCYYPIAIRKGTGIEIVEPDEKIIDLEMINILFRYPLLNPVELEFKHKDGFTRQLLYEAIYDGYKKIYIEDGPDHGVTNGTYNRRTTQRPYGIWGHVMSDLYIESVIEEKPGRFSLSIGS